MQWTVVAIATRGGADGAGVSPSPVSRDDPHTWLLYTSDAAAERSRVGLGGPLMMTKTKSR
jgi:hypothetical protein